MSWIGKLYDTYVYCEPLVGKVTGENEPVLLPIAHTTQNAHIEFCIDSDGSFLPGTARVIENKKDSVTVIPCTEKSQSRSGIAPIHHPLFDKLQYLAGDYVAYGGEKGNSFHNDYMKDLRNWCESRYANKRVCAILKYLEKGTLVADLISERILPLDDKGKLIRKWDSEKYGEKRGVFLAGSALHDSLDAFVRIDVRNRDNPQEERLWNDPQLWRDFISYYAQKESSNDLCYVRGIEIPCSEMSPAKIRGGGDKAKLISANDSNGFTYRGRFTEPSQVARIGYETTQKAHNALKWLIEKQGFRNGDQVYVTWGTKNEPVIPIDQNSISMMDEILGEPDKLPYVHTEYARRLIKLMAGYRVKINKRSEIVMMGLDSATTGRMAIIYYEELDGESYLDRLNKWYSTCVWFLDYIRKDEKGKPISICGTPSPNDILFAVYGPNIPDKLKKSAMKRLMPCILANKPIPIDFITNATRRASEPMAMNQYDYRKTVSVACALIRKFYNDKLKEERFSMEVDKENPGRSYLFGEALAYYHYLETVALRAADENRVTNAMRLKSVYSRKPAKTMMILDEKVQPYINRLLSSDKLDRRVSDIIRDFHEVMGNIKIDDMKDKPLDPTYLLGYSAKLTELYNRKEN